MQKHFHCLVIVAGIFCTVPTSLADSSALAPRTAIQADYDHIYTAAHHKDMSRAVRYFTTDFMGEDLVNTSDKSTRPPISLDQLHQMAADYEEGSQTISGYAVIKRLAISGNQATATVVHHVIIVSTLDPDTRKRFHGIFDATTQDTWVKGPQGWLMQRGRGISLRVKRSYS